MIRVRDALDAVVLLKMPARRVVSLVPSVTETLFALGCGASLAGRTRFCIHPEGGLRGVPIVGGTKDPDVRRIGELQPDLVLANREENRREDVEALRRALAVHVSYPRDLPSLCAYLRDLGLLLGAGEQAAAMIDGIERARRAHPAPSRPRNALYLVWRRPWMAAGRDTFIGAMLRECGFENAVADAAGRYPEVDLGRFRGRGLEAVLLSSEPFPFAERHRAEVAAEADLPLARIQLVSGEAFSWFGCRTAGAFAEAARVLAALSSGPA